MASYCSRCSVQLHSTPEHQPHLCADVQKRLVRRNRQVDAVEKLLEFCGEFDRRTLAETIVIKLNQLGVTED